MFIIVASLVVVAWLFEGRTKEYENSIKIITESKEKFQNESKELKKDNKKLKKENELLYEKIEELENEQNENIPIDGDFATYQQTMIDLSDISLMIKQGNIDGAKTELEKIDCSGFSNEALAFYESLCRELGVEK